MAETAMTARQRSKIFAMAKTLCVGDDELHDIVRGLTGAIPSGSCPENRRSG